MDVILVDENDRQIGVMEKMEVHQKALLHRAFSVFIFNGSGEMLLQKRAATKYHSPGLWTNACCSHPGPGRSTIDAAIIRLQEEMGFSTSLQAAFHFIYKASFDNGLAEHEYDHVFTGIYDGEVNPDPSEVGEHCYRTMAQIDDDLQAGPIFFTEWFKIAFPKLKAHLSNAGQSLDSSFLDKQLFYDS